MHATKTFIVVTSLAVLIAAPELRAADTAEEAALREALRKATEETGSQQSSPAAVVTKPSPAPAPAPAPVAAPAPKPVVAPVVVVAPVAQPAAPAAEMVPATAEFGAVPASNSTDDALIQALRTQQGEVVTPLPTATTSPSKPAGTMATPSATVASAPAPAPITAPELPISATKEQKLAELLRQYKADQITPEQYHTQRAAILAGQ